MDCWKPINIAVTPWWRCVGWHLPTMSITQIPPRHCTTHASSIPPITGTPHRSIVIPAIVFFFAKFVTIIFIRTISVISFVSRIIRRRIRRHRENCGSQADSRRDFGCRLRSGGRGSRTETWNKANCCWIQTIRIHIGKWLPTDIRIGI